MAKKTQKMTIRATLVREFEIEGTTFEETEQVGVASLFAAEVAEMEDAELASELEFAVEGEETAEGGRTSREVAEEWQGVCSEQMDAPALIDALCLFIDKRGLASKLDDFLRKLANEGMSDPAAE